MKKIKNILLLTIFCFSYFTYSQSGISDSIASENLEADIKIIINDDPNRKAGFLISFYLNNKIPEEFLQTSGITLTSSIHNNSSNNTPGKICIKYRQTNGLTHNLTNCTKSGSVGGVCIPPLKVGSITNKQIVLLNEDGGHCLDLGKNTFELNIEDGKENIISKDEINIEFDVISETGDDLTDIYCIQEEIQSRTNNSSQSVTAYPNPFNDTVEFNLNEQNFNFPVTLEIYNSKGILQDSKTFKQSNASNKLNYYNGKLQSGLYYYKLIGQKKVINGTLLKK